MLSRRSLLRGGGSLILAAPAIVKVASLMPLRGEKMLFDPPDWRDRLGVEFKRRLDTKYILDEAHNIIPIYPATSELDARVVALLDWAKWFEEADRRVAQTELPNGARVSTVFLGIDHGWDHREPPVLFETMVFGGRLNDEMDRYHTWQEAERGHAEMVHRARLAETPLKLIKGG